MKVTPQQRTVTGEVGTGPLMQCLINLCYLMCQCSTEIRLLTWAQVDHEARVIHFVPTKSPNRYVRCRCPRW